MQWCRENERISRNVRPANIKRLLHFNFSEGLIIDVTAFDEPYLEKFYSGIKFKEMAPKFAKKLLR